MENTQLITQQDVCIFNFHDNGVRVIVNNNEPLFCLRDICEALNVQNISDVKSAIDREFDKGGRFDLYPLETNGGKQNFIFITEPQLYFVLMRSDKPNARPFRQWVVKEVLPSIRKNGGYIANQENMSEAEILAKAVLVAQNVIANKDKLIAEQKQVIEYQSDKLASYKEIERAKRSKAQIITKFNKTVRLLADQRFNRDYPKAYNYVYGIFASKHCINEQVNMQFLKNNIDYLTECLEIALSEIY